MTNLIATPAAQNPVVAARSEAAARLAESCSWLMELHFWRQGAGPECLLAAALAQYSGCVGPCHFNALCFFGTAQIQLGYVHMI